MGPWTGRPDEENHTPRGSGEPGSIRGRGYGWLDLPQTGEAAVVQATMNPTGPARWARAAAYGLLS